MILLKQGNNPVIAASFLAKGLQLALSSELRRFIIIPILINIVLYSIVLALGYYYVDHLISQSIPSWLHWLNWILYPLFFIVFFVVSFFSFTVLANLIAAPFYGLLASKTLSLISGAAEIVEQPIMKVLLAEAKRLWYILIRMLPLLILFVIPGINIIASIIWAIFGAWSLAMEFMAYPLENEGLLFLEQKALLKTVRLGALSFGGLTMLGLTLPLLNILIGPAAVVGATVFLYELREQPKQTDEELQEESEQQSTASSKV
jgi:CysZ protein